MKAGFNCRFFFEKLFRNNLNFDICLTVCTIIISEVTKTKKQNIKFEKQLSNPYCSDYTSYLRLAGER